jgi:hypothetical protein
VKYVKKTLERYERDGLSFQRYLRATQAGAGDDILANNCMPIVGLYRDVYGVQPMHDRLWLEPHITPSLAGTRLEYSLRGRAYRIELDRDRTRISHAGLSISSAEPFGANLSAQGLEFFAARERGPCLDVTRGEDAPVELAIESWSHDGAKTRAWIERVGRPDVTVQHRVLDLPPGERVELRCEGEAARILIADERGRVEFTTSPQAILPRKVVLEMREVR